MFLKVFVIVFFADIVHPFNTDTLAANSDPLLYLREPDVLIVAFY